MQPDRFEACLAETLVHEGGWSDDPHDPGGPTNRGITLAVYAGHLGRRLDPGSRAELVEALRRIPAAEVGLIYRRNYWDMVRGDELPPGIDLAIFDFAVNSGPPRAIMKVQGMLGVAADGHLGPLTLSAIRAADPGDLVRGLMAERRAFLKRIPHFWRFGKGWLRRCDAVERAALAAAYAVPSGIPVADPAYEHEATHTPGQAEAAPGRAMLPPRESMAASGTAQAASLAGGGGLTQLGMDAAAVAAEGPRSALDFWLRVASKPSFWAAVVVIAGAAWVVIERRRHWRDGVR